jgi:RNA-directed DNA polymerase
LCNLLDVSPDELKQITINIDKHYRNFDKSDAKGKVRSFNEPLGRLKKILGSLNKLLQRVDLPDSVHGGRKGKSTKSNAEPHTGQPMVVAMDIKDFFPGIRPGKVYDMFVEHQHCSPDVARILTRLTTYEGKIPQGSPTSTIVAALVTKPLALRLQKLAEFHKGNFTQYVDDITFSGPEHLTKLKKLIAKIVRQEGFKINLAKTKEMRAGTEQTVTGIRVNDGPDVPTKKIAEVRALLDQLESGELEPTEKIINSLKGKIQYISGPNKGAGKQFTKRLKLIMTG